MLKRALCMVGVVAPVASAQLVGVDQFDPGVGAPVDVAYDRLADRVWTYGAFATHAHSYTVAGTPAWSIPRPGESADDFGMSVTTEAMNLGGTILGAGALLLFNGEVGVCEVYAVDKSSGAVLASLTTAFGQAHVVGGTHHPDRNTLFLVQDRNASSPSQRSRIAEIDPVTGAVLNDFGTGSASWTVNYGDIEVHPETGNLWLVSSDESTVRVLTPTGVFVEEIDLPGAATGVSGLAFDRVRGEAWVANTDAHVLIRLGGASEPLCPGDVNSDGVVNALDFNILAGNFRETSGMDFGDGDLNLDGAVNASDFNILASNFNTVCP